MPTSAEPRLPDGRLPYERPVVIEHGSLADLTRGVVAQGNDNNGAGPGSM